MIKENILSSLLDGCSHGDCREQERYECKVIEFHLVQWRRRKVERTSVKDVEADGQESEDVQSQGEIPASIHISSLI